MIPGAESSAPFRGRVRASIEWLAAAHGGQRLAVFTTARSSGGPGAGGRVLAVRFFSVDNGSISWLVVADPRRIFCRFNGSAYLE